MVVTEQVTSGWVLESIECEASGPVSFNISNTSVTINCNGDGAMIRCEFNNVMLTPVPTLSEWGLIAMATILGIVGFMVVRRRKVTT